MLRRLWVLGVLGASLSLGAGPAVGAPPPNAQRYIVVLKDEVDPLALSAKHHRTLGAEISHVFKHALKGYAAELSAAMWIALEGDPDIVAIYRDQQVTSAAEPCTDLTRCQALSIGVDRIDGELSSTRSGDGKGAVNINVAVLDDGGPVPHPDLNVAGSVDCLKGQRATGRPNAGGAARWHGTMVGGFIGARDNDIGRVGIAPGARLWAIRVLDDEGLGYTSEVICGVDWVTGTRTDSDQTNDIRVANMSLGGPLGCMGIRSENCAPGQMTEGECGATTNPLHLATCRATSNAVVVVASAGNEGQDFATIEPATFSEVLTATAMADRDGQPGGLLPPPWNCNPTETSADDSAADWSNFATLSADKAHTVAAPGVCIGSTYLDGQYSASSGTSFSSPLVAGTVALCISAGPCANLTPAQIVQKITAEAEAYNTAKKNSGYGFQGDPLRPSGGTYYGYLIRAGQY